MKGKLHMNLHSKTASSRKAKRLVKFIRILNLDWKKYCKFGEKVFGSHYSRQTQQRICLEIFGQFYTPLDILKQIWSCGRFEAHGQHKEWALNNRKRE